MPVRGFVTGSTDTSLWTVYNKGVRNYCGNALAEGKCHVLFSFVVFENTISSIHSCRYGEKSAASSEHPHTNNERHRS